MKTSFEEQIEQYGELIYTVVGVSMMPFLRQRRDLVLLKKPEGRLKKYDVVLYRRDTGKYVLHRILRVRDADYVICGDNTYELEYGITDRHIIGVLHAIVRDGKMIDTNSAGYKLYTHIWCDFFPLRAMLFRGREYWWALKCKLNRIEK